MLKRNRQINKFSQNFDLRTKQAGFTLVELVIAMSVFTVGIMAAFTLSLANINVAEENYYDVLASNLGREGVELIRNIRDNNWLKMEANQDCDGNSGNGLQICAWNQDLTSDGITVYYNYEDTTIATGLIGACYANGTCRLYRDADNFYSHNSANSPTNFARVIYLVGLCMDSGGSRYDNDGPGCAPGDTLTGLKVIVNVRWYRGTKFRDITVTDNIYNWQDYAD